MKDVSEDIRNNINIINKSIVNDIFLSKILIDNELEDIDIFKEVFGREAPFKFVKYISKFTRKIWQIVQKI